MQAQSEIETRILAMIAPTARSMRLDIVRVRVMGRDRPILQIMLERPDGTMDVAACPKFADAEKYRFGAVRSIRTLAPDRHQVGIMAGQNAAPSMIMMTATVTRECDSAHASTLENQPLSRNLVRKNRSPPNQNAAMLREWYILGNSHAMNCLGPKPHFRCPLRSSNFSEYFYVPIPFWGLRS